MQNNVPQLNIWEAFQLGEERAFHHLYATYYGDLLNYAFSMMRSRTAAEDCVQDFFIHLWKKREKMFPKTTVRALLIGCFRNFTIDFIRKTNCRTKHHHLFSSKDLNLIAPVEQQIIRNETEQILHTKVLNLLNTLTTQQREALYLRYFEEMDVREIAEVMHLSYAAAAKHLSRATQTLEQQTRPCVGELVD